VHIRPLLQVTVWGGTVLNLAAAEGRHRGVVQGVLNFKASFTGVPVTEAGAPCPILG